MEKYKYFPGSSDRLPRQIPILIFLITLFHKVKFRLDVSELIGPNEGSKLKV